MFIYFILYWKVSLLILLKSIYKCRFWLQQRKRKRCWFQTVAAAVRVSRNACRGCELVMIDRLDWWTCRTRYYMCYRERYRLTIDQKREYACGMAPSTCCDSNIRACQTLWRGISILDEWTHARPFRMSHFRSPLASCRRTCVVNMQAFIDVKFVVRTQFSWKILLFSKAVPVEQISSEGSRDNEKDDILNF